MLKEILKNCGVEEEKVNDIVKAMNEAKIYTTNLENADVRYNKVQEQKKQLEEASKNYEKQLKELSKNNADNEELKKQLEQLQLSNKELEANHKLEMEKLQFDFALEGALTSAKCKNNKALKALLDINSIKYQEGKLNGLQEQIEALQKDASYLFDIEVPQVGSGFNPTENKSSKQDFKNMTMLQRLNLKNSNPALYAELAEN